MNLRPKQAADRVGVSLSMLYALHRTDPTFPRIIPLSPKCSVIREEELEAWMKGKAQAQAEADRQALRRAMKQSLSAGVPA